MNGHGEHQEEIPATENHQPEPPKPSDFTENINGDEDINRQEEEKILSISPQRVDQGQYEDELENGDLDLAQVFLESKKARKKADEDAQLLRNRIKLLEMEEQRAKRRIDEAKKKADEITIKKTSFLENQKKRQEEQDKRVKEIEKQKEMVTAFKDEVRKKVLISKETYVHKVKQQVEGVKKTKDVQEPHLGSLFDHCACRRI